MSNGLNLQEINQEQALDLMKFFIRSNQNICLLGRRGVGKSILTFQAAEQCGYNVIYLNLSVLERTDLVGFPVLFDEGDTVKFKSPQFLPELKSGKPNNIILFDEVDKASPDVTAPLLEILQFRKINGKPINVASCVLTGNLMNEGSYSNAISSAILDRCSKYILSFDFDKWIDWAKNNDIHDLVIGFLKSNPNLACGDICDDLYASPSPRGWEQVSDALKQARELKLVDSEAITNIVSGFVGTSVGIRFKAWYEHYRKFEPHIISFLERGEMIFNFDDLVPTEKVAFVITACHLAKLSILDNGKSKQSKRFIQLENLCKLFYAYNIDPELITIGLQTSFNFNFITKNKLYACKPFFKLYSEMNEIILSKK
jgi:hypothetical protein